MHIQSHPDRLHGDLTRTRRPEETQRVAHSRIAPSCLVRRLVMPLLMAVQLPAMALDLQTARDYLGMEYAHCTNWFLIMREVAARSFPPGLDRNLAMAQQEELAQKAFERSAEATSREIALARSKASMQTMKHRIDNSLENLPVIADEYAFPCKLLMESPQARLQFWLDQK